LDIVTDELKEKLQPASRRLMEIENERMERRKVRKRTKNKKAPATQETAPSDSTPATQGAEPDVDKKPEGDDLEDESVYRKKELEELEALISPDVKADIGASPTGWYELVGECVGS
jgi:ubiquitin carboxyl-terminal hydrolase 14